MLRDLYLPVPKALIALAAGVMVSATSFLNPTAALPQSAFLAFGLVWASFVDIERQILPNPITLGLLIVGLFLAAIFYPSVLLNRTVGGLAGYLSLFLLEAAYRLLRKREGLGRGDAKLFAAGGAWLGWSQLPAVMLIGSATAIFAIVGLGLIRGRLDRNEPIPFGPFIAFGIWTMWVLRPV